MHGRTLQPGVYLLGSAAHGWYKIGYTRFVEARAKELARFLPFTVAVVGFWEIQWQGDTKPHNPAGVEKLLHAHFSARKVNGEWFALTEGDITAFGETLDRVASGLGLTSTRAKGGRCPRL